MGDRIAVMNAGVIQQIAEPLTLYQHPANLFVAGFIGAPPMNFFGGMLRDGPPGLSFIEKTGPDDGGNAGFTLRIPPEHATSLAACAEKRVILGLRPENISVSMNDAKSDSAVDAVVELVEPLGAETFFHLATAGHSFVARPGTMEGTIRPGQNVSVIFNLARCHIFDPATGLAIF